MAHMRMRGWSDRVQESIYCGDGKGVTNTVTTGVQDDRLNRLLKAWPPLPVGVKDSVVGLVEGK
jgi:hypothetical protein